MKSHILNKLFLLLTLLGLTVATGYAVNFHLGNDHSRVVYADKKDPSGQSPSGDGSGDGESSGNDSSGDQYSFYHLASTAATYFDASQNPNTGVKFMEKSGLMIGNAGGLIGYEDSKYDKNNWIGAMTSNLSSSAQGHSYQTYASSHLKPIYYFVLYGHALNALGLDSTTPTASVEVIARKVFGFCMIIAYVTAVSVPMIFQGIVHILVALNPFQFFVGSIQEYANSHYEAIVDNAARAAQHQQHGGDSQIMQQGLQSLTNLVHGIFVNSQQIGMAIIPITLLMSIGLYFMFNLKMGSILKKAFLRLFVLVLGVPLLADCYTNSLLVLQNNTDHFSPAANEIIASTFDDFQGWAASTQLAMPQGAVITLNMRNSVSGQIADSTNGGGNGNNGTTEVRNLARMINHLSNDGLISDLHSDDGYHGSNVWHKGNLWHGSLMTPSDMAAGLDVLGRYANDARYEASDFETSFKANPYSVNESEEKNTLGRAEILAGIKYLATNPQAWDKDGKDYFKKGTEPKAAKSRSDFLWNASRGGIKVSQSGSIQSPISFTGDAVSGGSNNTVHGLSTLSMYNYLTMSFTDSTVTAYSMRKLSSMMVAESHHSVNLIGTSTTKYGYLINAFIVLICITILGWGYALALLLSSLSNMFKILVHAPWAAMGFLTSASKLITCVLLVIAQIFITIFMFQISMDMLMALNMGLSSTFNGPNIVNNNVPGVDMGDSTEGLIGISHHLVSAVQTLSGNRMFPVMGANSANAFSANSMGTLVYLAVASLITMLFTFLALRLRGQLVSGIGEAIGNLFDKIFLTGASNPLSSVAAPGNGGAAEARDDGGMSTLGSLAQNAMYMTSLSNSRSNNNASSHNPTSRHSNPKNNSKNSNHGKGSGKGPKGQTKGAESKGKDKIGKGEDSKGNLGSFDRQSAAGISPKGDLKDMANTGHANSSAGSKGHSNDGIPLSSLKSDNAPTKGSGNKSLGDVAKANADSMHGADVNRDMSSNSDANSNLSQAAQDNAQNAQTDAQDMQNIAGQDAQDNAQDMPAQSGADQAAQDMQNEADQNGQDMQSDLQDQADNPADQGQAADQSQAQDAASQAAQDMQDEANQNGQDMQNDLQDQADTSADQGQAADQGQTQDAAEQTAQDMQDEASQNGQAMQDQTQGAPAFQAADQGQAADADQSAQAGQTTDAAQTAAQDSTSQAVQNGQAMQQDMASQDGQASQGQAVSQSGQADQSAGAGSQAAQTAAQDSTSQAAQNGQAMQQDMASQNGQASQGQAAGQSSQVGQSARAGSQAAQTAAQDSTAQAAQNGQAMGQQMASSNGSMSQNGGQSASQHASAGQTQSAPAGSQAAQTAAQDSTAQAAQNGQAMGQQMASSNGSMSQNAGRTASQGASAGQTNGQMSRSAAQSVAQSQAAQNGQGIKHLTAVNGNKSMNANGNVSHLSSSAPRKTLTPVGNNGQSSAIPTSRPATGVNNVNSVRPTSVNAPVNASANASQVNNASSSQYANNRRIFNNKMPTGNSAQSVSGGVKRPVSVNAAQAGQRTMNNMRRPVSASTMPQRGNNFNATKQSINRVQNFNRGQAGNSTRQTAKRGVNFNTSNLNSRNKK